MKKELDEWELEYRRTMPWWMKLIHPFIRDDRPRWLAYTDRATWIMVILFWAWVFPPVLLFFLFRGTRESLKRSFSD